MRFHAKVALSALNGCGTLVLQESIAVTQNYVSDANLSHVLKVLAGGSAELVSGCATEERGNLHHRFVSALKEKNPEALLKLHKAEEAAALAAIERQRLSSLFKPDLQPQKKKPRHIDQSESCKLHSAADAEEAVAAESEPAPFSFGFNFKQV